jgi:hypothetical protein
MSPAASPLAPFEISIAGRRTALSWPKHVGIHRETHTAAGFPPFEARVYKQAVEPFLFSLLFYKTGAGNDHRMNGLCNMLALGQAGCKSEVFDAGIGAGSDEYRIDLDIG